MVQGPTIDEQNGLYDLWSAQPNVPGSTHPDSQAPVDEAAVDEAPEDEGLFQKQQDDRLDLFHDGYDSDDLFS